VINNSIAAWLEKAAKNTMPLFPNDSMKGRAWLTTRPVDRGTGVYELVAEGFIMTGVFEIVAIVAKRFERSDAI
jgi:hypothetical protein